MAVYETIPLRSEVDPADVWAVEDLFPTEEAWEEAFAAVRDYPEVIGSYRGRLAESADTLYEYLTVSEKYERQLLRLIGYAHLRADEDTTRQDAQARKGKLSTWLAQAESATAFVVPEILAIPEERLEEMMEERPELALYRRFFQQKRQLKDHILSPSEESLLAGAGEMADAPSQIYSSLIYADMKFPSVRDLEGHVHELTNGTYISLMQSPDDFLRRNTFTRFYEEYGRYKNTFAAMLQAQMAQLIYFARARGYGSAREAALAANEVPVQVYDQLIDAVHANLEPMYRYLRLRQKLLRTDKLHMYDVYVPLVPGSRRKITFEEARDDLMAMTQVFGEEYNRVLASAFTDRWIDIYENRGKRSGAYSSFTQEHPFVLMNYKNDLDSEFTLAHELGHSMHSYFSHAYQPQVYSSYVIFVAEVASTCNEALLTMYLLDQTRDKRQRAILLNHFLEQFRSTVYRQTMFAEFERDICALAEEGHTLTAELLCRKYKELNDVYYGDEMVVDDDIALEWARIPHFYYNFYVYQYATGFAAAIALSRRIRREGAPAVQDYLAFLSGGCSQDPITLLKQAGVDMTSPEPVNEALAWFSELVDEFTELTK